MLSFCEEAWDEEQRSKLFTYHNKVVPLENFKLSKSAIRICQN